MSNVDYSQYIADATQLGKVAAGGIDSMVDLAELVYNGAKAGKLDMETSKLVYNAYLDAQNGADTAIKVVVNKDSLKNSYSRLNLFVKLANSGDGGWALAKLAIEVRRELKAAADKKAGKSNTKIASTYISVADAARNLNRLAAAGKTWEGVGKDQIREWITPDAPDTSYAAIVKAMASKLLNLSQDDATYSTAERVAFLHLSTVVGEHKPAAILAPVPQKEAA